MIEVFNRLTSSKLADCSLFRNMLDEHYQKFRYFYSLIKNIDMKSISEISCVSKPQSIVITIIPSENNDINTIIYAINERKKSHPDSKLFVTNIVEYDGTISIEIMLYRLAKEGELYDVDRFI